MKMTLSVRIIVMCLFLLAAYNAAYSVTFTSQYNGDGSFDIFYEGQLPTGVALDITLPSGLTTDYTNVTVNPYYNFFPDWAYNTVMETFVDEASDILGVGHPITYLDHPGNWDESVSNFCVSMAAWGAYSAYENVYWDDTLGEMVFSGPIGDLPDYDLNEDGYVDFWDLCNFSADWLYLSGSGEPLSISDFNGDGEVDMRDLGMMNGQQYLDSSSSGLLMTISVNSYTPGVEYGELGITLDPLRGGLYEVPEPATLSLLGLGGLLLRKRK